MSDETVPPGKSLAIVSGGSRGIGRAIARALIADGMDVAIIARGEADLASASAEFGKSSSIHSADVSVFADCLKVISEICSRWGDPNVLVTCAGSGRSAPPGTEPATEWGRMIEVNYLSTTNIIAAVLPAIRRRRGSVVCISSICAHEALGRLRRVFGGESGLEHDGQRPVSPAGQRRRADQLRFAWQYHL